MAVIDPTDGDFPAAAFAAAALASSAALACAKSDPIKEVGGKEAAFANASVLLDNEPSNVVENALRCKTGERDRERLLRLLLE